MEKYTFICLLWVLALFFVCRYIRTNYRMIKTISVLKKNQAAENVEHKEIFLHICVPCLREQSVIEKTLKELLRVTNDLSKNIKIYVVTTQKENFEKDKYRSKIADFIEEFLSGRNLTEIYEKYSFLFSLEEIKKISLAIVSNGNMTNQEVEEYIMLFYEKKLTTYEVVESFLKKNTGASIELLDYPESVCSMASQLNFCYRWIANNENIDGQHFFMVYNADCKPDDNTFKVLFDKIAENINVNVFQLIRAYTLNYDKYRGLKGFFLKASALYQTRWSLGVEYPMYENYFKEYTATNKRSYYMIGHGMTFSMGLLQKINGFHETTHLEDMYAGYVLSYLREPVIPIPTLENTLNPAYVNSWVKQKMVWFSGMYDVYNYSKYIKSSILEPINRQWSNRLQFQFFLRDTLPWLLGPSSILLLTIMSLLTCEELFVVIISTIVLNAFLGSFFLPYQLKILGVFPSKEKYSCAVFGGVIVYSLFRNIPAICYVFRKILKKTMEKYKTER